MKLRLTLISTDEEFTFLWQIWLSEKDALKVSLHHQDSGTNLGLLRVDFNSGHQNPESANEYVPEKFLPYTNKHFTLKEHHIHYHVQTYESLAWAVPLSDDDFEIKELGRGPSFAADFDRTIRQFAKAINLQTKLTFEASLL
jgi:5-hydroxyisourate hydrolase-like protein (transthyretin family)